MSDHFEAARQQQQERGKFQETLQPDSPDMNGSSPVAQRGCCYMFIVQRGID